MIIGAVLMAAQYPVIGQVRGVGPLLALWCAVAAIGDVFYWPAYHAYFSAVGDAEHRGHQLSAREALVAVVTIAGPLLGAWALVTLGPGPMFSAVGLVQAASAIPLIGAPNVAVKDQAPGAFKAARLGVVLAVADGWFIAWFFLVWQIVLFMALGQAFAAYGGAMALAALVGAALGLLLGRHVDMGHGRRAVLIAAAVAMGVTGFRAVSVGSPWLAVAANALGPLVFSLIIPAFHTVLYNLAKASPCPMRFLIAAEGGWDIGCGSACLVGAALAATTLPLSVTVLLALPALAGSGWLLRRYYARQSAAAAARPLS